MNNLQKQDAKIFNGDDLAEYMKEAQAKEVRRLRQAEKIEAEIFLPKENNDFNENLRKYADDLDIKITTIKTKKEEDFFNKKVASASVMAQEYIRVGNNISDEKLKKNEVIITPQNLILCACFVAEILQKARAEKDL